MSRRPSYVPASGTSIYRTAGPSLTESCDVGSLEVSLSFFQTETAVGLKWRQERLRSWGVWSQAPPGTQVDAVFSLRLAAQPSAELVPSHVRFIIIPGLLWTSSEPSGMEVLSSGLLSQQHNSSRVSRSQAWEPLPAGPGPPLTCGADGLCEDRDESSLAHIPLRASL